MTEWWNENLLEVIKIGISSLAVIGGAFALWFQHRRAKAMEENIQVNREDNIAQRFAKAIEHLGNEQNAIKLGGIHSLHQIAREHPETYREQVADILCSYIRETCPRGNNPEKDEPVNIITQTILNVITSNTFKTIKLNLNYSNLKEANLMEANLCDADLLGVNLWNATLWNANLEGTHLLQANLERTYFYYANLKKAILFKANLEMANLEMANLEGANLGGANLKKANFYQAKLVGANFVGADLEEAKLIRANLEGANLEGASLDGANFKGAVNVNQTIGIPDDILKAVEDAENLDS